MITRELLSYINVEKDQGKKRSMIREELLSQGWVEADIEQAFQYIQFSDIPPATHSEHIQTVVQQSLFQQAKWQMIVGILGIALFCIGTAYSKFFMIEQTKMLVYILILSVVSGGIAYIVARMLKVQSSIKQLVFMVGVIGGELFLLLKLFTVMQSILLIIAAVVLALFLWTIVCMKSFSLSFKKTIEFCGYTLLFSFLGAVVLFFISQYKFIFST